MIDNEKTNGAVVETTNAGLSRRHGTFVKGDPRINRRGRIKTFSQFRKIAQEIAGRTITTRDGRTMKKAEQLLEEWSNSDEPMLQRAFAEYAFGKVPDKLETSGLDGAPLRPMVIQVITPAALPAPLRECSLESAKKEVRTLC